MSDAIKAGLFHPNCKDSTSTYFEGITTLQPVTKEEQEGMNRREKPAAQKKYYENQAKQNHRIAEHSLDPDNQRTYAHRATVSREKVAEVAEKLEKTVATVDYSTVGSRAFSEETKQNLHRDERILSGNDYVTAILYKPDGTRCKPKKGKKDEVTFTKKEISQMQGGVLTHNHPDGTVFLQTILT